MPTYVLRLLRHHDNHPRLSAQLHVRIDGSHETIVDDACNGAGAAGEAGELGFDEFGLRIGRRVEARQWRLG